MIKKVIFPLLLLGMLAFSCFAEMDMQKFQSAPTKERWQMMRMWAWNDVLPKLSDIMLNVDPKFQGVRSMGTTVQNLDRSKAIDIAALTDKNDDYWRASCEMMPTDQLITTTRIFLYVANGEIDHAMSWWQAMRLFSNPQSGAHPFLEQLGNCFDIFYKDLAQEIGKGVQLYDAGNIEEARKIYKDVLKEYPMSATAYHELWLTYSSALKTGEKTPDLMEKYRKTVYRSNPLNPTCLEFASGKEMYLEGLRGMDLANLLRKGKDFGDEDFVKYADIARKIQQYGFAAHLYWLSVGIETKNLSLENKIERFLYCLEKLEITDLKTHFKGDHQKSFEEIDRQEQEEISKCIKVFKK